MNRSLTPTSSKTQQRPKAEQYFISTWLKCVCASECVCQWVRIYTCVCVYECVCVCGARKRPMATTPSSKYTLPTWIKKWSPNATKYQKYYRANTRLDEQLRDERNGSGSGKEIWTDESIVNRSLTPTSSKSQQRPKAEKYFILTNKQILSETEMDQIRRYSTKGFHEKTAKKIKEKAS